MIILYVLLAIILLSAVLSAYCFFRIFYSKKRTPLADDEYEIPDGEIYEVYRDQMVEWIKQIRRMPKEELEVVSYDGLVLKGKYYEYSPDSTIEILFHGCHLLFFNSKSNDAIVRSLRCVFSTLSLTLNH